MGLSVFVCVQATWQHVENWIKARESTFADLVDFSQPDHDQTNVINLESSTSLMTFNGYDLISH